MRRSLSIPVGVALLALACGGGYQRAYYDPSTGQTAAYTDVFQTEVVLREGVSALRFVVDADTASAPFLRGGGPQDLEAPAELRAHVRNLSRSPIEVVITDVVYFKRKLDGLPQSAQIPPGTAHVFELGKLPVNRFATELPFDFRCTIDGQPEAWSLSASRGLLDPQASASP